MTKNKQYLKTHKEKQREAGLERFEAWVRPEHKALMKRLAEASRANEIKKGLRLEVDSEV